MTIFNDTYEIRAIIGRGVCLLPVYRAQTVPYPQDGKGRTQAGRTARMAKYNADGSVEFVCEYFYDVQGICVAAKIIYSNGGDMLYREYTYDLLETRSRRSAIWMTAGVMTMNAVYSGVSVTVSLLRTSADGAEVRRVLPYGMAAEADYAGRSWGPHEPGLGNFDYIELAEYDANGNMVKQTWHNADGTVREVNWVSVQSRYP